MADIVPTPSEISILDWAFKGLVAVVLTAGGGLCGMLLKAVGKNRDDLSDHKLHVADNYIKKDVVDRVHERIDSVDEKMDKMKDSMEEKLGDIRNILINMKK